MYIRTKVFHNKDGSTRTYLQLVTVERAGNTVRQKVMANLGRLEDLKEGGIDRLIESLARFSEREWIKEKAKEIKTVWSKEWDPAIVFHRLWEELAIGPLLSRLLEKTAVLSDFEEAIFAMVLNRLCDPASKLSVSEWMNSVYRPEWEGVELHHLYRALDFLTEKKDAIECHLYHQAVNLFNLQCDLVFWDTTTTYFEGKRIEGFTEYGFSKDKRPDRVQVMIGVLLTGDGFPIAHEVFPGNTAEGETFRLVIEKLKKRFAIRRVILIADRGMVSEKLIQTIEEVGYEYIVGVRMRKAKAMASVLSRRGRYQKVSPTLLVKEVIVDGKRYLVCLNPEERERERHLREEALNRLQETLASRKGKELIGNSLYRRYLKMDTSNIILNEEVVADETRYDGKYVLRTNTSLSPALASGAYKALWQIELAFRDLKSRLDLRPVYHWTEKRIRGHIMICFLALVLEIALKRKLEKNEPDKKVSFEKMLFDLSQLKAVEVTVDGKRSFCRTELIGEAHSVFKVLGMRPPLSVAELP